MNPGLSCTLRPFLRPALGILAFVILCGASSPLQAGTYGLQAFTFPNGTTNLGDNSTIASNDGTASVQNNALRLTANGTGSTSASFKLPDLDAGKEAEAFEVIFRVRLFSSSTPADGFSLNFGNLPSDNGGGEGGFAMANGLVIAWDTYNNTNDAPSIEIFANGVSVGNFPQTFIVDGNFRPVVVRWDANGLDVTYNNTVICSNLPTPGFAPVPGNRFGFSARTGGASEDVHLDDLLINTTVASPIETGGPVISEFVADNSDSLEDEDADSPDWIEIYNGQNANVNLAGWKLTNAPGNLGLWTFPSVTLQPYQYLVLYASGKNRTNASLPLHTSFTLQRESGYVALVNPGGTVVSERAYGNQVTDVSFGETGHDRTVGYLHPSTPGAKNTPNVAAGPPAEDVVFSRTGGLITGSVQLGIAPPATPGAVVRYTTNNTEPGPSSTVYSAPFTISTTNTIRARVFAPNRLPGPVSSRTFIRLDSSLTNYNGSGQPFSTNLPIVILDSFGVPVDSYTSASNRAYRFTYGLVIPPDPVTGRATITDLPDYQGRGATHVRGESSAGFAQRQYAWELRNNEDEDKAESLLGLPSESDWILYAPGSEKSLMRDFLVFGTMRRLRNDYMAARTKYVEVFFNQAGGSTLGYSASYKGIYVLKEKLKIDSNRVNLAKLNSLTTQAPNVEGGYIIRKDKVDADSTTWTTSPFSIPLQSFDPDYLNNAQLSYIQNYINQFGTVLNGANFAHPTNGYAAYIDTDTFIDAQWFVEWTKQVDGYGFSTYYHKDRGGKLRAGPIWDFNIALGNANYGTGDTPTGWYQNTSNGVGLLWYPRLHQDPWYRLRHWDRFWEMRRGLLATNEIHGQIDANASYLLNGSTTPVTNSMPAQPPAEENAVRRHFRKHPRLGQYDWPNEGGYASRIYYNSNGNATTGEVDYMKNWLQTRLEWLDDQNRVGSVIYRPPVFSHSGGNVSLGHQLSIAPYSGLSPAGTTYATGTLYYTTDGSDPRSISGGISGSAAAYSGAITLNSSKVVKARLYNGNWSPAMTAVFVVDATAASAANLVVSELHYNPLGPNTTEVAAGYTSGNQFEFIELLNVSAQNVDLSGVTISDAVEFNFSNGAPDTLTLPPGGRVLVVGEKAAFLARYGNDAAAKIAGDFAGNLSNSGELITVRAANGDVIAQFSWGEGEPWPVAADGSGYSLVLNNAGSSPAYGNGASWRSSAEVGGEPGSIDSVAFTGSASGDSDSDGLSDYLEYATGSNHTDPASAAKPSVAIAPYIVGGIPGNYMQFQFRRSLVADGCSFTVLFSEDATTWQSGPAVTTYVGTVNNGDGTATVTYRSTAAIDSSRPRMFMRLQVSP